MRAIKGLVWRAIVLLAAAGMASCGGGGGGGDGGTPGNSTGLALANVRVPTVDVEVFQGNDRIAPITVLADVTGDLQRLNGATVFVVVEDPDQLLATQPTVALGGNGKDNQLHLSGRSSNAVAGDFRGNWRVNVCLDAACQRPFGGSPVVVPYHVRVLPGLNLGGPGAIELVSTFPDTSAGVTVAAGLPQGAARIEASVVEPSGDATSNASAFSASAAAAGEVAVTGRPAPVGVHTGALLVTAQAQTTTGRQVSLSAMRALRYVVNPHATVQVAYLPAVAQLSLAHRTLGGRIETIRSLAADGQRYQIFSRAAYLPAGPAGNSDAGGLAWVAGVEGGFVDPVANERHVSAFSLGFAPCRFDPLANQTTCLAPGRYEALVYLWNIEQSVESPTPLQAVLTVTP